MPHLSALFSGMSYKLTLTSNSSTAPLRKRVLTAYLAALKTSDEQYQASCEKIIEVRNLLEHSLYRVRTAHLTMTPR
jgi:hypothetical protein